MKGRQSRYVTGGESFAEIARLPSGAVVRLCLNTGLEDALRRPPNRSSQPSPVPGENAGCQRVRRRGRLPDAGRAWPHISSSRYSEGAGGKKSKNVFARLPGGEGK